MESTPVQAARRPVSLTAFLAVLSLACLGGGIHGLLTRGEFLAQFPRLSPWMLAVMIASAFVSIAANLALLCWRRWGLWVHLVTGPALFALELAGGLPFLKTLRVPVSLALLALLLRPHWRRFC
jgi:hypothetical protein